jgi:hypothetical protein
MQPTQHPEIRSMFGAILDRLTQSFPTPGGAFLLHYATRNRTNERSVGLSGVEHSALLNTYANALDKAYAHFTSSNENWDKPVKPTGFAAIPVYVTRPETHTLDPFTLTKRGQSSVWLRCLIHEANIDMMLLRAELDALHEVTHLFTHRHHPPSSNPFDPWKWFDEATAVYMERRLGPLRGLLVVWAGTGTEPDDGGGRRLPRLLVRPVPGRPFWPETDSRRLAHARSSRAHHLPGHLAPAAAQLRHSGCLRELRLPDVPLSGLCVGRPPAFRRAVDRPMV